MMNNRVPCTHSAASTRHGRSCKPSRWQVLQRCCNGAATAPLRRTTAASQRSTHSSVSFRFAGLKPGCLGLMPCHSTLNINRDRLCDTEHGASPKSSTTTTASSAPGSKRRASEQAGKPGSSRRAARVDLDAISLSDPSASFAAACFHTDTPFPTHGARTPPFLDLHCLPITVATHQQASTHPDVNWLRLVCPSCQPQAKHRET